MKKVHRAAAVSSTSRMRSCTSGRVGWLQCSVSNVRATRGLLTARHLRGNGVGAGLEAAAARKRPGEQLHGHDRDGGGERVVDLARRDGCDARGDAAAGPDY